MVGQISARRAAGVILEMIKVRLDLLRQDLVYPKQYCACNRAQNNGGNVSSQNDCQPHFNSVKIRF